MHPKILAILIILVIFFISTFIFAWIYYIYINDDPDPYINSFSNALYLSVTIQTSIGLVGPPQPYVERLRNWIMAQSFITYLLSLGLVFILVKTYYEKDNKYTELKEMHKEISSIKKMLSKSR